jgi:hypothetical protein
VTKLALLSLLTTALLKEDTEHGLGVDTEGDLLDLYRLEQFKGLLLSLFRGLLFSFTTGLLGLFALLIGILAGLLLGP